MNRIFFRLVSLLLILLLTTPSVSAWSYKGHILITRSAVKLIVDDPQAPVELKALLLEGLGNPKKLEMLSEFVIGLQDLSRPDYGLDLYSFRPDELASVKSPVPALNSTEDKMHFLDMELFHPEPSKRHFNPTGAHKIRVKDLPRNPRDSRYKEAGFVTFRTESCYKNLTRTLANVQTSEEVFLWIGYLSHYLSDSYQPYHSTIDYRGHNCPCNQKREVKPDLHSAMEGDLFRDERPVGRLLRERFWQYYQEALLSTEPVVHRRIDPYDATVEALLSGYNYLPMMCGAAEASLAGGEFSLERWFDYSSEVGGRRVNMLQVKAIRMAQSAKMLKILILQAWEDGRRLKN